MSFFRTQTCDVAGSDEHARADSGEFAAVDLPLERATFRARVSGGADEGDGEDSFVHAPTMRS